uniref:Uncharacterized protein n=1 Tax=Knipowitschia caucasica TaxID=637954 RepID=A0AAV2KD72_KNICA
MTGQNREQMVGGLSGLKLRHEESCTAPLPPSSIEEEPRRNQATHSAFAASHSPYRQRLTLKATRYESFSAIGLRDSQHRHSLPPVPIGS